MKKKRGVFDTSDDVSKKKGTRDINREPEMIELKRMIRDGELNPGRLRSQKTLRGKKLGGQMISDATEKNGQEVTQPKEVLDKIIGEMIPIVGDLMVAETWLEEGWNGTLDPITHVAPVLERTVSSARQAVEKVLDLCYKSISSWR